VINALGGKPSTGRTVNAVYGAGSMPYALFCNDAQISKAYPSEARHLELAQRSGLVVDVGADEERPGPRRVPTTTMRSSPAGSRSEDPPRTRRMRAGVPDGASS